MKLDVELGTEGKYLRRISTTAGAAEELGFDGLWTSETKHDALGPSAAIAFSHSPNLGKAQ
jgi:alkanesulfonate monooxygenase SsuD/methylene tetrahydromethanopterin reductase-like flavin-dependent oxidoreductase (luciferase family)